MGFLTFKQDKPSSHGYQETVNRRNAPCIGFLAVSSSARIEFNKVSSFLSPIIIVYFYGSS
jgi:hypothetical protein